MRRWLWIAFAFVCVMLAGCGESKKFTMEQVDVSARIMPDGDLFIQELFTYRFEGSWNGMTRYIDPKGHEGIEFFEAYIPPEGKRFEDYTYDDLQRLTVDFNEENDTYYIHTPSSDETKRVYYRYRVKGAAVRYADTGDMSWSFFRNNNDDIHHVTIDLQLQEGYNEKQIHYFLHDRTGGEVSLKMGEDGKPSIHYYNELLDQDGTARLRMLFPGEWLSEQAARSESLPLDKALAEEQQRERRLVQRLDHLAMIDSVLKILCYGALLFLLLQILPLKRSAGWFLRRNLPPEKLDQLDPLLAVYIYRKGQLKKRDIFAGVFSMRHKGLVTMEEKAAPRRFLNDRKAPDIMPEFSFRGRRSSLNEAENFFLNKFFYGKKLETDRFAGPTKKEKKDPSDQGRYRRLSERIHADFKQWREHLDRTEEYHEYVYPNRFRQILKPALMIMHFVVIVMLFLADVSTPAEMGWGFLIVGVAAGFALALPRRRWLAVLFYFCCFAAAGFLYGSSATETYALLVVATFVLDMILRPYTLTLEGWKHYAALRHWRRRLKRGRAHSRSGFYDPESSLRLAEFALVLDAGPQLLRAMKRRSDDKALQSIVSRISQSAIEGLVYSQKSISYMPPDPSSSSGGGGFSGGGGGGGGGTGAF
ncbi:DUF2207 domain-containing protein [Paenibacillus bouchesdurhonensis]|uniref:DUF2207 domain-containing protein n=1 Tax=Paenibacillus bouchesdurhonensis TaxID=1870990 RepID=UPI000DA5EBE7|nr:DUF2207 domain-containing protein [Paenibacillus bouchesdurhonensis]